MALGQEQDKELKRAFHDLRELKVDVAYPLLIELYHDYIMGKLGKEVFFKAVRLIESYVFRRSICGLPPNSMNKTFATFTKNLNKDRYLESIQVSFSLLKSYRSYPSDEDFKQRIQTCDLYNKTRTRTYCLRRLENNERKEPVPVDEYTIEHILPQNENLSPFWKTALGPEWKRIQETWLHTLGNLTLTGYNSEYSDKSFLEKRDMKGGFAMSPLLLNQDLRERDVWDEAAIKDRADRLAQLASQVWIGINMSEEVIDKYRPKKTASGYSIEDHSHLLPGPVRDLFELLRKEVIAMDPCVTEEFFKYYIAYKAETNFVDVVVQAKALRLTLNMSFPDINDPKGICKDVSGLGRWGNGDVEVKLTSPLELPYILGLIRQSFNKQMGNGFD